MCSLDENWTAFECDNDHFHVTKYKAPEYPYFFGDRSPFFIPPKLLPVAPDRLFDMYRFVEVADNSCPIEWHGSMSTHWQNICNKVKFAVGWTTSYKKFAELSKEAMNEAPPTKKLTKEVQEKLLDEFENSALIPFDSLLKYGWNWCNKLEGCDLTQHQIIEKVIFKMPFDVRLHLLYKRPENKFSLAYLLNNYDETPEDIKTRMQFLLPAFRKSKTVF